MKINYNCTGCRSHTEGMAGPAITEFEYCEEDEGQFSQSGATNFHITTCGTAGCGKVSLLEAVHLDGGIPVQYKRVYPPIEIPAGLPRRINKHLTNALSYLYNHDYNACANSCRKTLEAFCKHLGVKESNNKGKFMPLKQRIDKLYKDALIERKAHELAIELIKDCNLGSHDEDYDLNQNDASFLFAFVSDLVYDVTVREKNFDSRLKAYLSQKSNRPKKRSSQILDN